MTSHKGTPYIKHILDSIKDIEESTRNLTKKDFSNNKDKKDANIRRIEVIGEAVKNLPISFRNKYPDIPWKDIAGMRDKLTHHYFGINVDTICKVIKEDIPKLKKDVLNILNNKKED